MATAKRRELDRNGDGRTSPEEVASGLDSKLKANPAFDLPNGYDDSQGTVRRTPEPWLNRNPWVYPLAGIGTGLAGGAMTGGGAAAAGGAEASIPTTMGIGSGGAAGLGAAAGGGLGGVLKALAGLAPVAGMFGNPGGSLGSNASDILSQVPQLKALLDLQLGQAQRADPLHQSLVTLSQRLLPNSSR